MGANLTYSFKIPKFDGTTLSISVEPLKSLYVLGANGHGKSSLMHLFLAAYSNQVRRISAHRQTWFSSNASSYSPEQRRNTETNIRSSDHSPEARWKDNYSAHRATIAIYDLIDAENVRAREIAGAIDSGDLKGAQALSRKPAPIKEINQLLKMSNIPVEIFVGANQELFASKNGGPKYSVAELSDGERNALLIAATVLTAEKGMLILIDEPERHLHRSITSPLLNLLFAYRDDCAFIVSTHDVSLAMERSESSFLLLRGCKYNGSHPVGWDADLIADPGSIGDELKRDILGARRSVVFVEGTEKSLDLQLYRILLPEASVVAKESCRAVVQSVKGIRETNDLHWVRPFGIIDNDSRSEAEIDCLGEIGVFALRSHSVESIYYHPEIQARIARLQVEVMGGDAGRMLAAAKGALLDAIKPHTERLAARTIERLVREEVLGKVPSWKTILNGQVISIPIDTKNYLARELARISTLIEDGKIVDLVSIYPVRETPALDAVTKELGFRNREHYENAVKKLLVDDASSREFAVSMLGGLKEALAQ